MESSLPLNSSGMTLVFSAQFDVKGRGGLNPFVIQIKFHETVINKQIGTQKFNELFGCQMIANRGKTDPARDAANPSQSTEQACFTHAKRPAFFLTHCWHGNVQGGKTANRDRTKSHLGQHSRVLSLWILNQRRYSLRTPCGVVYNRLIVTIYNFCR